MLHELAKITDLKLPKNTLEQQYYSMLKKGIDKQEAIKKLFDGGEKADARIRKLGSVLKKKMVAQIVRKASTSTNRTLNEHIEAYQLFSAGKILLAQEKAEVGIQLIQKSYNLSIQNGIIDVALSCTKSLSTYHSNFGDIKKFVTYQSKCKELIEWQRHETLAQQYYNEIALYYREQWNEDIQEKAIKYCEETKSMISTSYKTAMFHYFMQCMVHVSSLDFEELIATSKKAIAHFNAIHQPPKSTLFNFQTKLAVGYIQLEEYKKALAAIKQCLALTEKGGHSYCVAYYYQALAGLHSGNYLDTIDAIDKTKPYWNRLPNDLLEQWRIIQAYSALFIKKKYRIGKFINEVPIFSKDKTGANTAIIIVQMLHHLKEGNTSIYIERCDALKRYTSRYLSGKKKVLAKMLLEVAKGHFNITTIEHRTREMLNELAGKERELEIMPPEKVWGMVMGWL